MNKILYTPWRMDYINSEKEKRCIFCLEQSAESDQKHLVLYRSEYSFVIMNLYPYNNGHLMVVPVRHVSHLTDLNEAELSDLMLLVQKSADILTRVYHPDGMNIGMNLGKAAGAGVDSHIHMHLVPRWQGDANFMATVGGTRLVPEEFEKAYSKLKEQFDKE